MFHFQLLNSKFNLFTKKFKLMIKRLMIKNNFISLNHYAFMKHMSVYHHRNMVLLATKNLQIISFHVLAIMVIMLFSSWQSKVRKNVRRK